MVKIITKMNVSGFEIFNVGSGVSHTVLEVVNVMQDLSGMRKEVVVSKVPRKNEIPDCYASVTKLKNAIDWSPQYDLRKGVQDMLVERREGGFV